ncbi:MAG: thymidine phosphorylase [Kiritimatiellae bacterium]|nr:thymidine phosphorylase [Kiritimatiellia bacterium]
MIAKLILDKKREGRALGSAEIREFIDGFTRGEIPDYQMSALAMAVCCRGMTPRETADLTDAMMRSGACLDWRHLPVPTADKHSTGGVGDKLSLIIQPLAASCGVAVPSLTGRGLGITGGTADKLETIPGYNASLSLDAFRDVVAKVGVSMTVQTAEICPADKKLYALRDVTGTVASIPLICGSILSKKWAEGADALVFDVKFGCGAFMKTREEARELAVAMVESSKAAGRKAAALVTDMNAPLGYAVGNANEVAEALDVLRRGEERAGEDFVALSIELASLMVSLAKSIPLDEARALCMEKLADGSALSRFEAMVKAQGGDLAKFESALERPVFKFRIQSMRSGYVSGIDAEKTGRVAMSLGAGRMVATDKIDPRAGITLSVKTGDRVSIGTPLATLEKSVCPDGLEHAAAELMKAFSIASESPPPRNLIAERIV